MADKALYTTTAINTGAREGESHSPDRSFEVNVDTPKEMGGKGNGTDPEQLFALGYSACFHSALEHFKKQEKVDNRSQVTLTVNLLKDPTDGGFKLAVDIEVGFENMEEQQAQELAEKAHAFCPYSKATKGNIDANVTVVPYEEGK
ncbi:organic hydroperoxide resistance protein [Alkalibacterium sp. MB6]|uniref:organic hydroperoxide resistance protein n=1 Tax=Alkalibacterium sp. MB6 TaxID=2081965 RepID=UPI00137A89E5|nr:organic hydroperoxide resistance protein [Alkalibacterium sp. MB6]